MLFDTWAGLLAPGDVREFAVPYARRVFDAVRGAAGPGRAPAPAIYYAGEASGWIEAAPDTGADVIGIDWRIGLEAARVRLGAGPVIQGNLDPAVLLGPPERIRERTREVLRAARRGAAAAGAPAVRHIFNLGHGILPETPPEHARLVVDTVRECSGVTP